MHKLTALQTQGLEKRILEWRHLPIPATEEMVERSKRNENGLFVVLSIPIKKKKNISLILTNGTRYLTEILSIWDDILC